MATLCAQGAHIVQKLDNGIYICIQCGLSFREHHEILIAAGVAAAPKTR